MNNWKEKTRKLLKKKSLQAAIIIALSQIIFFYPVFFSGEIALPDLHLRYTPYRELKQTNDKNDSDLKSDQVDSYYPEMHLFLSDLKDGNLDTWENSTRLGVPRDMMFNFYFYPDYLGLVLPLGIAITIVILGKFFIGGFGMYLFLRSLKINHVASLFGGIVFMYSGFNMAWNWNHAATTSLMAPMILFLTNLIIQRRYKYAPLLTVFIATLMLTGFVAGAGYVLYIAAGFAATMLIKDYILKRTTIKLQVRHLRKFFSPYIVLSISVLIGISMSIFTLIPTLNYLNFVDIGYRSESNANYHLTADKSLPQSFMAYYNGGPLIEKFIGEANLNETSSYIGAVALIFLLCGIYYTIKKKRIVYIYFLGVYILSILVVYNIGPFLSIINNFPIFNNSANTRLLMWTSLCGSIIAAYGFDSIIEIKRKTLEFSNKRKSIFILLGLILFSLPIITILLYKLSDILNTYELTNSIDSTLSTHRYFLYRYANISLTSTLMLVTVLISLSYLFIRKFRLRYYAFLIIAISFAELFTYGRKQVALTPKELFYPITPGIQYLMDNTDETNDLDRIMSIDGTFATRGTETFYNLATPFTHGLYSKQNKDTLADLYKDPTRAWATRTMPLNLPDNIKYDSELMDILNIKYIAFPYGQKLSEEDLNTLNNNFELVFQDIEDLTIYENKSGASLVHTKGNATVEINEIDDTYESFTVTSVKPDTFYTSEIYYPSWKVKINGQPGELIKVDDIWRGVDVPAGENHIEFYYDNSEAFNYGLVYAIIIGIVVLGYYIYLLNRWSKIISFKR